MIVALPVVATFCIPVPQNPAVLSAVFDRRSIASFVAFSRADTQGLQIAVGGGASRLPQTLGRGCCWECGHVSDDEGPVGHPRPVARRAGHDGAAGVRPAGEGDGRSSTKISCPAAKPLTGLAGGWSRRPCAAMSATPSRGRPTQAPKGAQSFRSRRLTSRRHESAALAATGCSTLIF